MFLPKKWNLFSLLLGIHAEGKILSIVKTFFTPQFPIKQTDKEFNIEFKIQAKGFRKKKKKKTIYKIYEHLV